MYFYETGKNLGINWIEAGKDLGKYWGEILGGTGKKNSAGAVKEEDVIGRH